MAGMSTYLANAILNAIFNSTAFSVSGDVYISLHTGDPGITGANEMAGGSYARKQMAAANSTAGQILNSASLDWSGLPTGTITHIGIWDAVSGGNYLNGVQASAPRSVTNPGTYSIGAGRFQYNKS